MYLILGLDIPSEGHALAGLAGCFLVRGDIVVELLLLLVDLCLIVLAVLGLLDLQSRGLEEQLQHLVLDLAILQSIGSRAAGRLDLFVEGIRLGSFCRLSGCFDDGQVALGDAGQVARVDLDKI